MKKTYFFLLLYLTSFLLFGQSTNLFCATDIVEENYQKQFPGVVETRAKMELEISRKVKSGEIKLSKPKNGFYEIPIVVHVIHTGEAIGTGVNKTDQQIIDWVNYSNAILAGTASGFLGPNNGGTEIPFKMVIAQRDAECNDVLGIVRKNGSVIPGYAQHGLNYNLPNIGSGSASSGASQEDIRNLSRWDAEQYYNVYVVNTIGGTIGNTTLNVGGFAYFPGASPLIDGTFMRASVVGTTSTTFAHEMGHAFGLYHTFEGGESDGSTCPPVESDCSLEGDRVCDTEVIKSLSGVYSNYPTNSDTNPCTGDFYKGTQYNVMHYGSSLNRFTPGQRNRAMSMTLVYRSNLLNSNALITEGENVSISLKPATCTPTAPQNPLSYVINYIKFGDLDHYPNALNSSVDFYKDYSKLCLGKGHTSIAGNQSTNFTVQTFSNSSVALKVYIDWNNDGRFDETKELAVQASNLAANSTFNYSILPPAYAVKNIPLRMRVVSDHSSASINACRVQYGMIRDYAVTVNETVTDCSGISSSIEASSDINIGSSNQYINLYAAGVTGYQTVQYQWQKSVNAPDQWQNILDANAIYASDSPSGEIGDVIYYRLKVTCLLTHQEYFSNVITYEISPVYCTAGADSPSTLYINSVKFGSINNASTFQNGYSNFSSIVTDVVKGNSYNIEVTPQTGYSYNKFIVWIDFNNDGDFDDEGEQISTLTSSFNKLSGKIHIPIDKGTGKRRMRIRLHYDDASSDFYPNFTPCGNSTIGEVEDYTINIVDLGCSGISDELTASISNELPTINQEILLSVSGVNGFNGVESYWQKSTDKQTWENLSSNETVNFAQNTSSNYNEQIYYRYYTKCLETQTEKISNIVSYTTIPQYCAAGSQSAGSVYIKSFTLGDYKKTSTSGSNGYQNNSLDIIEVKAGDELNVVALPNGNFGDNRFFMWVDFNNDGDFDDEGETIQTVTSHFSQLYGTLKIPTDIGYGLRRVRVRLDYNTDVSGVNNTACGNSYLGEVEDYSINIVREETIWNGNSWSNGVPTIEKDAIIIGELQLSTDLAANSITIEEEGKIVVKTGTTLTINQKITNKLSADRFVVEHDANLIQLSGLQNIGDIQVYRNSSSMLRNDMTFWSSPVVRQNVRAFSPETLLNRFWTYDENLDEFAQIFENPINLDPTVYSFEKGKGIAIRVRNTLPTNESTVHAGLFTGNPINGAVEVMVSYQNKGYNMIGNPYASNVDVNTFLTQNSHVNSLYFWTHQYPVGSAQFNENFAAYTLAGGTLTDIETIAVGQGFIVGVNNSNSVVFNNTMRTNDQAIFYKENQDRHRVWLSLAKEDQKMSQILVAYLAQATNEFDHQIDAKVINPGASAIYTIIDQEAYAIQGRALPFDTQDRVALGFEAVQEGEYSIQIEAKDGLFENSQSVYVYDKALDIIHDLVTPYYFKSSIGKFDERFELIYQNRDLGLNDSFTKSNILIYTDANDIVVESMDALISKIEVINLEGQKVWTKDKIQQKSHRLRIPASGVLILHITTEDGKETIKKVLKK